MAYNSLLNTLKWDLKFNRIYMVNTCIIIWVRIINVKSEY